MIPRLLPRLLACFAASAALATARETLDYFDNSLAKACRPLDKNLDLMFLLDGSGSVSGNTFDTQIRMVKRVIEQIELSPNKTRISILQYSGYTKTEIKFGEVKTKVELLERLKGIRHISGTTRTGKALRRARNGFSESQGARPDDPTVAQVVVVVGDGHSLDNPVPASREIRQRGVTLLTMGIGNYVNMNELEQMTEDPSLAFNNETMDEFISTFRRIAVGEVCDFARGPDGAEIVCNTDHILVNIDTQKDFHGHVYVPDHFKNPACAVHRGNVGPRGVSLRIPLDDCGVQEQFLFAPRGLLAQTSVRLMYHPSYNHPADKTFPIRCFYPDARFHGKEGEERRLQPHFDSESLLRLQGDPLIASFPVPKMEMPCAYTVRSKDAGCVLEDAKVGDDVTHHWECDPSIIGDDYGFFIHSCIMEDGDGRQMEVLDKDGCPADPALFSEVDYSAGGLKASASGSFVNLADAAGMKFRCSVRFCNRAEGECEAFVPAACGPDEESAIARRRKRQVNSSKMMKEMADFMPPHMVERLFMRRAKERQAQGSAGNSSEEAAPVDRFGRPILQTFSSNTKRRLGVPSIRSFRPISQLAASSAARRRQAVNVKPLRVTPSTRPPTSKASPPEPSSTAQATTELPTSTTDAPTSTQKIAETTKLETTKLETTKLETTKLATTALPATEAAEPSDEEAIIATAMINADHTTAKLAAETTELPISTTAIPDENSLELVDELAEPDAPIAALKEKIEELIEESKKDSKEKAEEEKKPKMPVMAGSVEMPEKLSFDDLLGDAIAAASEEITEADEELASTVVTEDPADASTLPTATTIDVSITTTEEVTIPTMAQADSAELPEPSLGEEAEESEEVLEEEVVETSVKPVEDSAAEEVAEDESLEEEAAALAALAEASLEESPAVAPQEDAAGASEEDAEFAEALEAELADVAEAVKEDEELAEVVSEIRKAVSEGEMGMELVGLAVDIVAGLQLGQVQIESQTIRVRRPAQQKPSAFNFCPRPAF